jgi:hypothetical protein
MVSTSYIRNLGEVLFHSVYFNPEEYWLTRAYQVFPLLGYSRWPHDPLYICDALPHSTNVAPTGSCDPGILHTLHSVAGGLDRHQHRALGPDRKCEQQLQSLGYLAAGEGPEHQHVGVADAE